MTARRKRMTVDPALDKGLRDSGRSAVTDAACTICGAHNVDPLTAVTTLAQIAMATVIDAAKDDALEFFRAHLDLHAAETEADREAAAKRQMDAFWRMSDVVDLHNAAPRGTA